MPLRASQTQPRGWRSTTPHPARTPPSIHWWCKILDSTPVVTSMYCNTDSSLDYVLHDSDQMYDCTLFFVRFPSPHASRGIDGSIDGSFRWLFVASCFLLQTREHRRVAILLLLCWLGRTRAPVNMTPGTAASVPGITQPFCFDGKYTSYISAGVYCCCFFIYS